MPRTALPKRFNMKLDDTTRYLLDQIALALGIDMSSTIRLIIREKARSLSIAAPDTPDVPTAKKRQRAVR